MKQAIIKFLMKLKENEIKFNPENGMIFAECFNHPNYLNADKTTQVQTGLKCARLLYQEEANHAIDEYFEGLSLSNYCNGATILDIGCYIGGRTIRWLEKYHGREIYGIDIDSRFLDIATLFAKERGVNALFKLNYAENLEFSDGFFDVIFSQNTFEHVRDVRKALRECYRVLRKRGYFIVLFPSFYGPVNHHLDLVTSTPCIHWIFKYDSILKAYFSILDERGSKASWYRREEEFPLPFEKGYSINGTGAIEFHNLIEDNWNIIYDGFKQKRKKNENTLKRIFVDYVERPLSRLSVFRELHTIGYLLQKP